MQLSLPVMDDELASHFPVYFIRLFNQVNELFVAICKQSFAVLNKGKGEHHALRAQLFRQAEESGQEIAAGLVKQLRDRTVSLKWHRQKYRALNLDNHFLYFIPEDLRLISKSVIDCLDEHVQLIRERYQLSEELEVYLQALQTRLGELRKAMVLVMLEKLKVAAANFDRQYDDVIYYSMANDSADMPANGPHRHLYFKDFVYFHDYILRHGDVREVEMLHHLPWGRARSRLFYYHQDRWVSNPLGLSESDIPKTRPVFSWITRGKLARYCTFADQRQMLDVGLAVSYFSQDFSKTNNAMLAVTLQKSELLIAEYFRVNAMMPSLYSWLHGRSKSVLKRWMNSLLPSIQCSIVVVARQEIESLFALISRQASHEEYNILLLRFRRWKHQIEALPLTGEHQQMLRRVHQLILAARELSHTQVDISLLRPLQKFVGLMRQLSPADTARLVGPIFLASPRLVEEYVRAYDGGDDFPLDIMHESVSTQQMQQMFLSRFQVLLQTKSYTQLLTHEALLQQRQNTEFSSAVNRLLLAHFAAMEVNSEFIVMFNPVIEQYASPMVQSIWKTKIDNQHLMPFLCVLANRQQRTLLDYLKQLNDFPVQLPVSGSGVDIVAWFLKKYPESNWSIHHYAYCEALLKNDDPKLIVAKQALHRRFLSRCIIDVEFGKHYFYQLLDEFNDAKAIENYFSVSVDSESLLEYYQGILKMMLGREVDAAVVAGVVNQVRILFHEKEGQYAILKPLLDQVQIQYYQRGQPIEHFSENPARRFVDLYNAWLGNIHADLLQSPLCQQLNLRQLNDELNGEILIECSWKLSVLLNWSKRSQLRRKDMIFLQAMIKKISESLGCQQLIFTKMRMTKAFDAFIRNLTQFVEAKSELNLEVSAGIVRLFALPSLLQLGMFSEEILRCLPPVLTAAIAKMKEDAPLRATLERVLLQLPKNDQPDESLSSVFTADLKQKGEARTCRQIVIH